MFSIVSFIVPYSCIKNRTSYSHPFHMYTDKLYLYWSIYIIYCIPTTIIICYKFIIYISVLKKVYVFSFIRFTPKWCWVKVLNTNTTYFIFFLTRLYLSLCIVNLISCALYVPWISRSKVEIPIFKYSIIWFVNK